MSRYVLIFVAVALLLPSLALAKRLAPAEVEPVIHQGVRYIAPNDDGRRAYIEAWDVQTNNEYSRWSVACDIRARQDLQS